MVDSLINPCVYCKFLTVILMQIGKEFYPCVGQPYYIIKDEITHTLSINTSHLVATNLHLLNKFWQLNSKLEDLSYILCIL